MTVAGAVSIVMLRACEQFGLVLALNKEGTKSLKTNRMTDLAYLSLFQREIERDFVPFIFFLMTFAEAQTLQRSKEKGL